MLNSVILYRMVSFLGQILGQPRDPLFVIRTVRKFIIWHQTYIAVEQELLLIQKQLQVSTSLFMFNVLV